MSVLKSASKIAFLALIGSACLAFLYEVVAGTVSLTADQFMILASGASAFYFAHKGENNPSFLGK